jgi:hypothetical protein
MTFFFLISKKGAAYIVASYGDKLEKEKSWKSGPGDSITPLDDASGSKYTQVEQQDNHGAHVPLTNVTYDYSYSDANNSFGGATPTHHHHAPTSV